MIDWDSVFKHNQSWPPEHPKSLCIQNAKPSHETARNIFGEDKELILESAERNGYRIVGSIGKSVSFVKNL